MIIMGLFEDATGMKLSRFSGYCSGVIKKLSKYPIIYLPYNYNENLCMHIKKTLKKANIDIIYEIHGQVVIYRLSENYPLHFIPQ